MRSMMAGRVMVSRCSLEDRHCLCGERYSACWIYYVLDAAKVLTMPRTDSPSDVLLLWSFVTKLTLSGQWSAFYYLYPRQSAAAERW